MNNFEKIKNMTLDEMAKLLSHRNDCSGCPCEHNDECAGGCFLSVRDWLQVESEGRMNKIEEMFFKIFEIKPKELEYPDNFEYYPDITVEKLLELICIINKNTKDYNKTTYFKEDYKNLKDEILENTLYCYKINCLLNKEKEQFKHQIQQLFKEQTNEK